MVRGKEGTVALSIRRYETVQKTGTLKFWMGLHLEKEETSGD
jgi:hypothetical protein